MIRKMTAGSLLLLLILGCAAGGGVEKGAAAGKAAPAITQSFAAREIYPGQTWKIYLKASDPDGDMANIYAVVDQPGVGVYPVSITRIQEGNRKELAGYIFLRTPGSGSFNFITLQLTVQVRDREGNFSAPVSFPLSFTGRAQPESPPPGAFPERNLGPIMINLRTVDDGDGKGVLED